MSDLAFPTSQPVQPNGQFAQEWRRFFMSLKDRAFNGVTSVGVAVNNGVSASVANPTTTPVITIGLGAITPNSVNSAGLLAGATLRVNGFNIAVGGNFTITGSFSSTFNLTGTTSVTFPTSGTLATLAGVEPLSNKSITNSNVDSSAIGPTTPATGRFTTLEVTVYAKTDPTTVSGLTAAATAGMGARSFVSDATQSLTAGIGATVVGGGANKVPVVSDGVNWLIG